MTRHPLDVTSAALLERVEKEESRSPTTASTHLIGGVAKVASRLDDFLRALLEEVATLAGQSPVTFLPRVGSRPPSLRRAPAGQLLRAAREAAAGLQVMPPSVRLCIEDSRRPGSVLGAVVDLRNVAVHQATLPSTARQSLAQLRALMVAYRREAGWWAKRVA